MGRSAVRALLVSLVVCDGACSPDVAAPRLDSRALRPPPSARPDGEVVYESTRVFDAGGNVVSTRESGRLSPEHWQRAARPWTHLDDAHLYHEHAWQRALDGGASLHGYRIVRTTNRASSRPPGVAAGPVVDPRLSSLAPRGAAVRVVLRLRDFPRWDIPLAPPPSLRAEDRAAIRRDRAAALAAR